MLKINEANVIAIELLNITHSQRLAEIIGTDTKLHMQLTPSRPMKESTAEEFYNFCKSWCERTNSDSYAIILDDVPIGLISIS
ncbi:MAG: hypothetical protein K0S55_761, partial [Clostridia bacterium]|nr:hypothetical protein [Clostridia bacterium]